MGVIRRLILFVIVSFILVDLFVILYFANIVEFRFMHVIETMFDASWIWAVNIALFVIIFSLIVLRKINSNFSEKLNRMESTSAIITQQNIVADHSSEIPRGETRYFKEVDALNSVIKNFKNQDNFLQNL